MKRGVCYLNPWGAQKWMIHPLEFEKSYKRICGTYWRTKNFSRISKL
jgi:hypothetical protein